MRLASAPLVLLLAACSTAPSARSPLREALAKADTTDVESAVKTCLTQDGWKVNDVGSVSGGSNVVTAYKAKDQTDVYVHPADQKPRITGGPEDGNPFWKCLRGELAGGGADKADKADKDKPDKDKGDKDKGSDKE